jgi:hypothetical protein
MTRFRKHYTLEQARSLLPQVRHWLGRLLELHHNLKKSDQRLEALRTSSQDLGGPVVNAWVRTIMQIAQVLFEFHDREIQIKDLERGLVDFPAFIGGKEAFLCWEQGEEDIEFWHDLDAGYAGRERL